MKRVGLAVALVIAFSGCGKGTSSRAGASASGSAAVTSVPPGATGAPVAVPIPPEKVAAVVNPKREAPYSGPTGKLTGRITIVGDPAPPQAFRFPQKCGEAAATYGKLFRVGQDNALADALVTVTKYKGFVPAKGDAVEVTIHGCATAKRTISAAFGQRIEVKNVSDSEPFMPYLDGAPRKAIMVALPHGDSVKLYPPEPGRYMLRDQLPNEFLTAEVFVVPYATHDVTGLDGRYVIDRIPVGKVKVDAFLPALMKSVGEEIEIKEGENTKDLEMKFDAEKDKARAPAARPAGSAKP